MKGWCSFATFLMAFLSNSSFASELHTPRRAELLAQGSALGNHGRKFVAL